MDEYTAEAFANRDEPVPVLTVPDDRSASSDTEQASSKRTRVKSKLSSSHLKEKLHEAGHRSNDTGASLQDRLLSK